MRLIAFISFCAFLLLAGAVFGQAPQYTIQDLGTLPNMQACSATAISQSGNVAGWCTSQVSQNLVIDAPSSHVFLYSKGTMTDLNITSLVSPFPTAINNANTVAGGTLNADLESDTLSASPFLYENGAIHVLPGQLEAALPVALNDAGQMAGTVLQANSNVANFFIDTSAFIDQLSSGTITQLSTLGSGVAFGMNSQGEVAGAIISANASLFVPVLWQDDALVMLPLLTGYRQGVATAVNDSGVAAGVAFNLVFTELNDPNAASHAVMFSNGAVTDLGVLSNDTYSEATGINHAGTVVGFSTTQPPNFALHLQAYAAAPSSNYHAFIYTNGKMYDLTRQLVNGAGWQLSYATQINDAGQIVGAGLFEQGNATVEHAFLLTPVPVPTVNFVAGAGLSAPLVTSISPNGLITIFGSNFTTSPAAALGANDITDNQLPSNLANTCVESGTSKWGLFFVSGTQINVLAGDLPASGTVPLTVVANCGTADEMPGPTVNVPVAAVAPEFLYFVNYPNGPNPVAAIEPNGANVGPAGLISGGTFTPAKAGDVLTAFGVGWGATASSAPIGTLATGAATLSSSYSLTLGGMPVNVAYAGLTPYFAGLYQIDFTVPAGLAAGNQPLVLTVGGVASPAGAYVTVGN